MATLKQKQPKNKNKNNGSESNETSVSNVTGSKSSTTSSNATGSSTASSNATGSSTASSNATGSSTTSSNATKSNTTTANGSNVTVENTISTNPNNSQSSAEYVGKLKYGNRENYNEPAYETVNIPKEQFIQTKLEDLKFYIIQLEIDNDADYNRLTEESKASLNKENEGLLQKYEEYLRKDLETYGNYIDLDLIKSSIIELTNTYKSYLSSAITNRIYFPGMFKTPEPVVPKKPTRTIQEGISEKENKQKRDDRRDPLLKKLREGVNYTEELKQLENDISHLDAETIVTIEKEEEKLLDWGEMEKQKVNDTFNFKRDQLNELFEKQDITYPTAESDHQTRLEQFDETEFKLFDAIDKRVVLAIIFMKKKYFKLGKVKGSIQESHAKVEEAEVREISYDKLYVKSLIHEKVSVQFTRIGSNMPYYFKKYASREIEKKCRKEGFIRPNSSEVISYSTGLLQADMVVYDVIFSADVCFPYENMELMCKIMNITKIGIRAIVSEMNNPIILFISREHNANKNFDDYEEGKMIKVRVIGHRFELNDEFISVIGEII